VWNTSERERRGDSKVSLRKVACFIAEKPKKPRNEVEIVERGIIWKPDKGKSIGKDVLQGTSVHKRGTSSACKLNIYEITRDWLNPVQNSSVNLSCTRNNLQTVYTQDTNLAKKPYETKLITHDAVYSPIRSTENVRLTGCIII